MLIKCNEQIQLQIGRKGYLAVNEVPKMINSITYNNLPIMTDLIEDTRLILNFAASDNLGNNNAKINNTQSISIRINKNMCLLLKYL